MPKTIKLGLLQIKTGPDKRDNLEKVSGLIDDFDDRPDIVITPEYLMGLREGEITTGILEENAESLESEFVQTLAGKAEELGVAMLLTTYRPVEGDFFNSSVFVDSEGEVRAVYDKIHLFDAFEHKESEFFRHGEDVVVFDWGDYKIGLATCFDLRFPELFRIMQIKGADIVLVPSGFYQGSYKSNQWRTLIGARAHENNFFVAGVNQPQPYFVGESMVCSPLGYEVDKLGVGEESKIVEIRMGEVEEAKNNMPIIDLLRSDIYRDFKPYG